MLYNLLGSLENLILCLVLSLSCGLTPGIKDSSAFEDFSRWDENYIAADFALRKEIMDTAQIRLELPELNFSVPVRYCLLGEAQDYVDMKNMAAMFQRQISPAVVDDVMTLLCITSIEQV